MTTTIQTQVLVDIDWVARHSTDPSVRVVEVSGNPDEYAATHLPGAVRLGIWEDMLLPDERVNESRIAFEQVMTRLGIEPSSTLVLYADSLPFGPGMAFWWLTAFGHADIRVMDGGIDRWRAEGRPLATEAPAVAVTTYAAREPIWPGRATKSDVLTAITDATATILDVRLPEEYSGELFRPGSPPAPGQRAGHIPGAVHVPVTATFRDDGRLRPVTELRDLYARNGVKADQEIIPYCTIGGRSGHTWFVLTQLLGYPNVRLYDASWAEWGQTPELPVE